MKALGRNWRHQPLTVRLLAVSAGLLTAAATFAAPADAGPIDDQFIGALSNSGINFGDQGSAVQLGQSICPMLARPGGNFAAAAARVRGGGISPGMADMFTTIAIQMYYADDDGQHRVGQFAGSVGDPRSGRRYSRPGRWSGRGLPGMPG